MAAAACIIRLISGWRRTLSSQGWPSGRLLRERYLIIMREQSASGIGFCARPTFVSLSILFTIAKMAGQPLAGAEGISNLYSVSCFIAGQAMGVTQALHVAALTSPAKT
jgi:hypothetical protein